jgi:seryl-tRNA synthetase
MFPKLASGTSGKSRENMGDDLTEMNKDQLRQAFFDLFALKSNEKAVRKWGQNHVRDLEQQIEAMEDHLQERNATIDELEAKLQDNRTHTRQTLSSMLPESDEERHQRHRRERMLDEVTLICVRDGIERMEVGVMNERGLGKISRDAADNICRGINQYDGKQ